MQLAGFLGKAERRYAGVTHIDVIGFTKEDAASQGQHLLALAAAGKLGPATRRPTGGSSSPS